MVDCSCFIDYNAFLSENILLFFYFSRYWKDIPSMNIDGIYFVHSAI